MVSQSLPLVVDTGSDCSLVTMEDLKRTNTASYKSDEISIHWLADRVTTSSGESATLELEFDSGIVPIKGLIANSICSPIKKVNPCATGQLKDITLTIDFGDSRLLKFKIDGLLGLETMVKLLPPDGDGKSKIRKVDSILFLGLGDKLLPLGSNLVSNAIDVPKNFHTSVI